MSPDSPKPSRQRRAWRAMSALGCLLGALSLFVGAWKWSGTDSRQDRQTRAAQLAICAVANYADKQAAIVGTGDPSTGRPPNPDGAAQLRMLADDMRSTGIDCPPDK